MKVGKNYRYSDLNDKDLKTIFNRQRKKLGVLEKKLSKMDIKWNEENLKLSKIASVLIVRRMERYYNE